MPDNASNPSNFWQELKRRKVVRVITVYAAAAFVILEVVSIIVEPLHLPEWTLPFIIVLLCSGFIVSVILSWVYDITPDGIQKTKPSTQDRREAKQPASIGWKISTYASVLVIIAFVVFYIIGNIKQSSDISMLEKSIAVIPFENWSVGEENSHLGDAIANEIITQLSKIQEFHVISNTSSSQYKGSDKPSMPQIGRDLGANFIIEGTIERQDDNVSIHVQVIQAENDNHIWAHEFKDIWDNLFKIRGQIAVRIAEELKTVLSREEIEQIEKNPTENIEAYNLYLRGRYFWNQRNEENLLKAIDYFNQAAQIDTNFALAYIGLADSYSMLVQYSSAPNPTYFIQAEQAALEALNIDNSLAEAHSSVGWVYFLAWKFKDAEKEFIKAIELNPKYATAHHWYSMLLVSLGRYDQAIEEILIAHNLEPLSLVISRNVAVAYMCARQYDKAITAMNKVTEIDPDFSESQARLVQVYLYKGMYEEALSAVEKSEEKFKAWRGIIYAQMEQFEKANQLMDELILLSKTEYISPFYLALLQFSLGYEEEGFNYLEKAFEAHCVDLLWIKIYPGLDQFISDPRFIDLQKKMELIVD